MTKTILQIVPRMPGTPNGVGDYASILAQRLQNLFSFETIFATPETGLAVVEADSFPRFDDIILHYVNYGYQKRGVPFALLSTLRKIRQKHPGRLLTIFHELYASSPPWRSAFWLRPFQVQIAKSIARDSNSCVVSNDITLKQLKALAPTAEVRIHPIFSTFGEPTLSDDQIVNRSPHRWVICGGTALIKRSLCSFRAILNRIPPSSLPRELFILGGSENPDVRSQLRDFAGMQLEYRPEIAATEASQIICSCAFGWLDYFHRPDVPTAVLLKSSAFAAACAHGVVPVLPHPGSAISVQNDSLPGPYFVNDRVNLPEDRAEAATKIYDWYQRHAASRNAAHGIAEILGITPAGSQP